MPGIVGVITKLPRECAEPQLKAMVQKINHHSSYRTGTWIDESLGVYVGWAAREKSFSDGMPICNESGDVVLVFSGEEFPEADIRQQLKDRGHIVRAPEGPSYLVHRYEDDKNFPLSLNGRFHGLVVDKSRGLVELFIDRYGMHRLYFCETKDAFYFAAEAKALLAVLPEIRETDARGLAELISCGCVLEYRTVFKGIQVLPAGSKWSFRNAAIAEKGRYFDESEWENQEPLDPESYYQELREVFSRNLPRFFGGTERIGISLTGGLDTRMILAWRNAPPGTHPCYTFGGIYRESQDVILARKVAEAWGQPYQVIRVAEEFLANFSSYAEKTVYLTDGCADVSRAPVLYANERAAEIAPVRMTGNYGSEVLRRLVAFKPNRPSGVFDGELTPHFQQATKTYNGTIEANPLSFIAFRQMPWFHWGLLALEQTQISPRSPFVDNDVVRTAFRAPGAAVVKSSIFADHDDCLHLIADGNRELSKIRTDRGLAVQGPFGFLMRTLQEVTFKAEYEYDYGMPQWLARADHALSGLHTERFFLGRHKYYHFRVWYRDQLSKYIREMLLDPRTLSRSYLDRKKVEAIVNAHVSGRENHTSAINRVLTLELLHRSLLDGKS
jgi:asparagine synthase (glutamine-hydrolysing)